MLMEANPPNPLLGFFGATLLLQIARSLSESIRIYSHLLLSHSPNLCHSHSHQTTKVARYLSQSHL